MAKLNKKMQDEVKNAATGFAPMAEGVYHFMLKDVDPTREGGAGPYWSWEFECVEQEPQPILVLDAEGKSDGSTELKSVRGRKQWNNTSLSQAWSLKQTFDAFGVSSDTDTDDVIGKVVKLVLSVRTIEQGNRKGELTNNVDRVLPPDPEVLAEHDKRQAAAKEMADVF